MNINSVKVFFSSLIDQENKMNAGSRFVYMREALTVFAKNGSVESASDVYIMFMDCYKHLWGGKKNFVDFLDTLRVYEESTALLVDKQRDHYIHSANVFLLGIEVYQNNATFRSTVASSFANDSLLPFTSARAEFLFRWGMTALFHDIGYPIEITNNQIRKFIRMVINDDTHDAKPFIDYQNVECLTTYFRISNNLDLLRLLSAYIAEALSLCPELTYTQFTNYIRAMQQSGNVDHGFYSALALLHHYSFLADGRGADICFKSILDAASAVLLHNYYKHGFQKEPFCLPALAPQKHPMAFLLMLCDELQDWNRKAYGLRDSQSIQCVDSATEINDRMLKIHYIMRMGAVAEEYCEKKSRTLQRTLEFNDIFPDGIAITSTIRSNLYVSTIRIRDQAILPRPFLDDIEKIAVRIHLRYNQEQLRLHPGEALAFPDWENLPDDLKYSNIRQARTYFSHLDALNMYAAEDGDGDKEVFDIPAEFIEQLAEAEHNYWMAERISNHWRYGPVKDVEKQISPYLVPYEELPEEFKQLDRNAVSNIFPLFHEIGLHIFYR